MKKKIILPVIAAITIASAGVAAYPSSTPHHRDATEPVNTTQAVAEQSKPETSTPEPVVPATTPKQPGRVTQQTPPVADTSPQPTIQEQITTYLESKNEEQIYTECFTQLLTKTGALQNYQERYTYITAKYAAQSGYKACLALSDYQMYGSY
jgi:hypothetical protein